MIRSLLAAALLATTTVVAQAQSDVAQCPRGSGATLERVLLMFSTSVPDPAGLCIYADGSSTPVSLRRGCDVEPVDTFMDAPPRGGMHECRESRPGRCQFVCRAQ